MVSVWRYIKDLLCIMFFNTCVCKRIDADDSSTIISIVWLCNNLCELFRAIVFFWPSLIIIILHSVPLLMYIPPMIGGQDSDEEINRAVWKKKWRYKYNESYRSYDMKT